MSGDLKQLTFVEGTAKSFLDFGEQTYCTFRGWVPSLLMSPVQYTESVVAPYYGKAQTLCHNVLVNIDGKVDYTVTKSQDFLKSGVAKTRSVVGDDAAEQFQEAKEKYVAVVHDGYHFVCKNGLTGTAKAAISRRGEAIERVKSIAVTTTKFVVSAAQSTVEYVTNQPAVQSAVRHAKPYADFAQSKYSRFHSALVHNPQYASLYKLVTTATAKILSNKLVKGTVSKSNEIVYPYVQFIADPALNKITPYVDALKEHLKPATAPAKPDLPPSQQQLNSSNTPQAQPAAKTLPTKPKKVE